MAITGETSDLDELVYGGEPVLPEQSSYKVTLQNGVVSSSFSAGMDKQQIQFLNSPYQVDVTYVGLDGFKIAYLEEFFNRNRGQKFIANLLVGGTELEPFVVQRISGGNPTKTGYSGSMQVTLQVEPVVDRCWQQTMFEWGQCVGSATGYIWQTVDEGIELWP